LTLLRTIHGAGATPRAFIWLQDHLPVVMPGLAITHFTHGLQETLEEALLRMTATLDASKDSCFLMGHSLGGVMAAALASHHRVQKVVCIAPPFGGSKVANIYRWFHSSPLFESIRPENAMLRALRARPAPPKPTLVIVATSGLPFMQEPNDGVLTVTSQEAITGARIERVDATHTEVLLHARTLALVRDFLA
jgi:pimeloyl-ACP methyl ester carboxylesterase